MKKSGLCSDITLLIRDNTDFKMLLHFFFFCNSHVFFILTQFYGQILD